LWSEWLRSWRVIFIKVEVEVEVESKDRPSI
jgi:hypothetical protein